MRCRFTSADAERPSNARSKRCRCGARSRAVATNWGSRTPAHETHHQHATTSFSAATLHGGRASTAISATHAEVAARLGTHTTTREMALSAPPPLSVRTVTRDRQATSPSSARKSPLRRLQAVSTPNVADGCNENEVRRCRCHGTMWVARRETSEANVTQRSPVMRSAEDDGGFSHSRRSLSRAPRPSASRQTVVGRRGVDEIHSRNVQRTHLLRAPLRRRWTLPKKHSPRCSPMCCGSRRSSTACSSHEGSNRCSGEFPRSMVSSTSRSTRASARSWEHRGAGSRGAAICRTSAATRNRISPRGARAPGTTTGRASSNGNSRPVQQGTAHDVHGRHPHRHRPDGRADRGFAGPRKWAGSPDTFSLSDRRAESTRKPPEPPPLRPCSMAEILDDALGALGAMDVLDSLVDIPDIANPTEPLVGCNSMV